VLEELSGASFYDVCELELDTSSSDFDLGITNRYVKQQDYWDGILEFPNNWNWWMICRGYGKQFYWLCVEILTCWWIGVV